MSNFQWVWRYSCLNLARTDMMRLDFYLWGWMKNEVYKENVNTRDELVARIMNSAALIKQKPQDDLRRATRTIAKRVEKCIEVDGRNFGHLHWTVAIYWNHLHNQIHAINKLFALFFILFVRLFMRNVQTAVSPHPLKIGHMFIWTYLLWIVHTATP